MVISQEMKVKLDDQSFCWSYVTDFISLTRFHNTVFYNIQNVNVMWPVNDILNLES